MLTEAQKRQQRLSELFHQVPPARVKEWMGSLDRQRMRAVCDGLGGTEGSLWWKDPDGDELVICCNCGDRADELELAIRQPLSEGLVSLVFQSGEAVVVNDAQEHPSHSKRVDAVLEQATGAIMVAPLEVGGALRGVISVVILEKPGRFSLDQLNRLQELADRVSSVLEQRAWEQADE